MKTKGSKLGVLIIVAIFTGCATSGPWFRFGPTPTELAGSWIDEEKTTAGDTSVWILRPGGEDVALRIRLIRDSAGSTHVEGEQRRYGYWYLSGALSDPAGRALCFKKRPRDGGTCRAFRLDTLAETPPRLRLTVFGYPGEHRASARVLTKRATLVAP